MTPANYSSWIFEVVNSRLYTKFCVYLVKNVHKKVSKQFSKMFCIGPDMQPAIQRIKDGELTQYRAATLYNIPRQTLNDRLNGKGSKQGRPPRLSAEEEGIIAEVSVNFSDWRIGLGKKNVIAIVADYLKEKNKSDLFFNGVPGRYWWSNFLRRNPNLSIRKPQSLQIARAKNTHAGTTDHWFYDVLQPLSEEKWAFKSPRNADETSVCLCGRPQKVVARKGAKLPQYTVGGTGKENITVQVYISASGSLLPPYILYSGQQLIQELNMPSLQRAG